MDDQNATRACGVDFGTSNSCVALAEAGASRLAPVEGSALTLPSAVFFSFEEDAPMLGRAAIAEYVAGEPGRLMRAVKSVLGGDLMGRKTGVGRRRIAFTEVIGLLIDHLKRSAEAEAGRVLDAVVLGRPVSFVGAATAVAEADAEAALIQIARDQGFTHVETQYEPIAAALQYEATVTAEERVLVVDIGGGTSDFSVVRVSPARRDAADRSDDVLGASGARVGGVDFDQRLSLARVMPLLGFRSLVKREMGEERIEAPRSLFFELATWHQIMLAYTRDNQAMARALRRQADAPRLFERLETVLENRLAHQAAGVVESAKITLSDQPSAELALDFIEQGLTVEADRPEFEAESAGVAEKIGAALDEVLVRAGLTAKGIDAVFITGGSANMPLLQRLTRKRLPDARMVFGDMFGSVGLGLALDARRKFG